MNSTVIKRFFALVLGTVLVAATPWPTTATSRVFRTQAGGNAAKVVIHLRPRCYIYQHHQRAYIVVSGLQPYERVDLEWAVTAPHSSGGVSLGPGTVAAGARGGIGISYPAPTKYFSDINHWVLTVLGPRNLPLASVRFRVVEGHPAYLPPTGPSQSCA